MASTNYETISTESPSIPLFGPAEQTSRGRLLNLVVGFITAFIVFVTLISAFIFSNKTPRGLNIFFAIVISMICGSHMILIYWYRKGDVDPKFKILIYLNAWCIVMLCICANVYFHAA